MNQLYESRHIKKYLGINKNQLYHWIQTKRLVKPAVLGTGRGGRSKFTFEDLLNLSLVKELYEFGLDLNLIKKILEKRKEAEFPDDDFNLRLENYSAVGFGPFEREIRPEFKFKNSIWNYYKKHKNQLKKDGYTLEINKAKKGLNIRAMSGESQTYIIKNTFIPSEREKVEKEDRSFWEAYKSYSPMVIIDLLEIIMELERKTGDIL